MVCGIGIYGRTNTAELNPPPPSPLLDKEGGLIAGVVKLLSMLVIEFVSYKDNFCRERRSAFLLFLNSHAIYGVDKMIKVF